MPSKKQRRRRAKERRHEWEEVYVDDEGNEIAPEDLDEELTATATEAAKTRNGAEKPITRGGRTIQPPSWRRVFKRALIFAPLMALTIYFLSPDESPPRIVFSTLYLLALFIPFSYFMDRLMYRRFAKQASAGRAKKR